jgi:hypothetical protein
MENFCEFLWRSVSEAETAPAGKYSALQYCLLVNIFKIA